MREGFKRFLTPAKQVVPKAPLGLSLKGSALYPSATRFTFTETTTRLGREVFSRVTTRRPAVKNQIDDLYVALDKLIAEKLAMAKSQNKKLMILIGENHDDPGCLLIELIAMKVALKHGIDKLGVELCHSRLVLSKESVTDADSLKSYKQNLLRLIKAASEHPLHIIPIDPEGDRNKPESNNRDEQKEREWNVSREEAMARELISIGDHVLGVVGAAHLIPLCEERLAYSASHEVVSIRARSFEGVKNELVYASVFSPGGYSVPNVTPKEGIEAWIYTGLSENRFLAMNYDPAAVKLIEQVLSHPYNGASTQVLPRKEVKKPELSTGYSRFFSPSPGDGIVRSNPHLKRFMQYSVLVLGVGAAAASWVFVLNSVVSRDKKQPEASRSNVSFRQ